jgi:hypothetical protein
MLRTTSIVSSVIEVPREWVFEHYLSLPVLHGQDLKIKSPFNPAEKNPSFFVYYSKTAGKYMFKDFSTDRQGDGVGLVKSLFNLSTRGEAAHKIIDAYNKFMVENPDAHKGRDIKIERKYKVTAFTPRHWNQLDANFWMSFKIGSKLLKHFRVQPLDNYTLVKEGDHGDDSTLFMDKTLMYGYFRADGTLYKIYQPYAKNNKFIKVHDYIQGTDQLTFKVPYLIICSSLKDMMAFVKLRFTNAETVAPDSENIPIPERIVNNYKKKYKGVCTLFDNDPAGINSMKKYEELYELPYVHLVLEKDTADNIKEHGIENTRVHAYPLLTKALTGKAKQL